MASMNKICVLVKEGGAGSAGQLFHYGMNSLLKTLLVGRGGETRSIKPHPH